MLAIDMVEDKGDGKDKAGVPAAGDPGKPLTTKERLIKYRNICINFPIFLFQTVKINLFMIALKNKIRVFVVYGKARRWYWDKKWYFQMRMAGYKFIKPEQMLMEFPPKKNHKLCNYGKGFHVVQLPTKRKVIQFCSCVHDQYKKSGKKYMIIQP